MIEYPKHSRGSYPYYVPTNPLSKKQRAYTKISETEAKFVKRKIRIDR